MINPLTERQKIIIVNNVVKATKNIKTLNKNGYGFMYLASGFIAHNNLFGFIEHYTHDNDLKSAILANAQRNRWDNFREGEQNYDYYMSKKDVYLRILAAI